MSPLMLFLYTIFVILGLGVGFLLIIGIYVLVYGILESLG